MKIKHQERIDEVIGVKDKNKFKISGESEGIVIHSLINLYSDPIGSIVREITSNCVDANRERNLKLDGQFPMSDDDNPKHWSDKQYVEVKFIDSNIILGIEASMTFIDYGVGLSPSRVKSVFTVFGGSTKRTNDLEIGGFGLGAKSPLSYTDTFYVRTVHNQREYYYMIYINNDEVPSMDLVKEKRTTDKNITEIIVPLERTFDKEDFRKAIENQIMFFDNVLLTNIEESLGSITTPERFEETDEYILSNADKCSLLIGKVNYPIDWNLLYPEAHYNADKIQTGLILKFDIGVLDLVPSRESIRYTPKTIKIIKDKIEELIIRFKQEASEYYNNEEDIIKFFKASNVASAHHAYRGVVGTNAAEVKSLVATLNKTDLEFKGVGLYKYSFSRFSLGMQFTKVTTTQDNTAPSGYRIVKNKVTSFNDLVNNPIYIRAENFSRKKDATILNTLKEDNSYTFISLKYIDIGEEECKYEDSCYIGVDGIEKRGKSKLIKESKKFFNFFKDSTSIEDYDAVEIDTTLDDNVGLSLSKKELRNVNKTTFLRQIFAVDYPDSWTEAYNNSTSRNMEYKIADLYTSMDEDEEVIIYGFTDEDKELKRLCSLLSVKSPRLSKIKIFKIAKTLKKEFKPFIHIKDFYMQKHPLLLALCTGYLCTKAVDKYKYLRNFEYIHPELHTTFKLVNNYGDTNYRNNTYLGQDLEKEIIELCTNNEILDQELMKEIDTLTQYCEGLELLSLVDDLSSNYTRDKRKKEISKIISGYLELLGKTHYFTEDENSSQEESINN